MGSPVNPLLKGADKTNQPVSPLGVLTSTKYTNPASRHSWLLQAKVVGPSYEGNEPSKESYCAIRCMQQPDLIMGIGDDAINWGIAQYVVSSNILWPTYGIRDDAIQWVMLVGTLSTGTENVLEKKKKEEEEYKHTNLKRPPSGRGLMKNMKHCHLTWARTLRRDGPGTPQYFINLLFGMN